jgi:hypothetical protein
MVRPARVQHASESAHVPVGALLRLRSAAVCQTITPYRSSFSSLDSERRSRHTSPPQGRRALEPLREKTRHRRLCSFDQRALVTPLTPMARAAVRSVRRVEGRRCAHLQGLSEVAETAAGPCETWTARPKLDRQRHMRGAHLALLIPVVHHAHLPLHVTRVVGRDSDVELAALPRRQRRAVGLREQRPGRPRHLTQHPWL